MADPLETLNALNALYRARLPALFSGCAQAGGGGSSEKDFDRGQIEAPGPLVGVLGI
mgnify:CR=1 FL=1